MQIFCDFDGTITTEDTTDLVLSRLADPAWETVEEQWKRGEFGSGECMRRQIAMIRGSRAALDAVLDEVEIDPGFADMAAFCRRSVIPLTIVSDGVDYFIHRILARHGFDNLRVITNTLTIHDDGRYSLTSGNGSASCVSAAGVCKCNIVAAGREPKVYIGDGRSDFCVADKNDLVFAKHKLAGYCEEEGIPFLPFTTLHDVTKVLRDRAAKSSQPTSSERKPECVRT